MCGSALTVKGGMVSVAKNYLQYPYWKGYQLSYISTHKEINKYLLVLYFVMRYMQIVWLALFGNYKIEQCFKFTWPMEYQREDYEHDVERNPFGEGFYDTPNPILVVFDRTTGMPVKHIGKLEDCQRLSRTGYYYSNATACVHDSEIAYTNGYTGAVYVCDTAQIDVPLRRYVVFDVDTASFPQIDSTAFYTYEYARRYDKFFTRCIMQLHLTDDTVYCLVKHGVPRTLEVPRDKYEVVAIDRRTGEAVHRKFPEVQAGESLLGCGLRELPDGGIAPFMFMRKNDVPVVEVFDFK